jgi:hypothetical protein
LLPLFAFYDRRRNQAEENIPRLLRRICIITGQVQGRQKK